VVPPGEPGSPDWLSDAELIVFDDVVSVLREIHASLAEADAYAIARYAADLVEYQRCRLLIEAEGAIVEAKNGSPYQHPAVGIRNKAHDRLVKFENAFGLSPDARERIPAAKAPTLGVRRRGDDDEMRGMLA
jgi:P27 family predicted phage terminase small subunit